MGGRKLTPQEALDRGLITDIVPEREFRDFIEKKTKELASLPPKVRFLCFVYFIIYEGGSYCQSNTGIVARFGAATFKTFNIFFIQKVITNFGFTISPSYAIFLLVNPSLDMCL